MGLTSAWTRAFGMSTARWLELPAVPVPVTALTPTQAVAADLWPARRPNAVACTDELVHVVQVGRARYLEDGHHRWARARRDQQPTILARVLVIPVPTQRAEVPA